MGQERIEVVRVPNPLASDASEAGNLSRIEGRGDNFHCNIRAGLRWVKGHERYDVER